MALHIQTHYRRDIRTVADGHLVLLMRGGDERPVPAIKGLYRNEGASIERTAATVLADVTIYTGETITGPFIQLVEDQSFDCLDLGADFIVDFDPLTAEFYPHGHWGVGLLAVDENGRMYIHAHSQATGQTFVPLDTGACPTDRCSVAAFREWSISLTRADGSIQELYRKSSDES